MVSLTADILKDLDVHVDTTDLKVPITGLEVRQEWSCDMAHDLFISLKCPSRGRSKYIPQ